MDDLIGFLIGVFFFCFLAYAILIAVAYIIAASLIVAPAGVTSWYLIREMNRGFSFRYQLTVLSTAVLAIIGLIAVIGMALMLQHVQGWEMVLASLYGIPAGLVCAYLTISFWGRLNSKELRSLLKTAAKEYNAAQQRVTAKKYLIQKSEENLKKLQEENAEQKKLFQQCISSIEEVCRHAADPRALILYKEQIEKQLSQKATHTLEKDMVALKGADRSENEEIQFNLIQCVMIRRKTSIDKMLKLEKSVEVHKQEYIVFEAESERLRKIMQDRSNSLERTRIVLN